MTSSVSSRGDLAEPPLAGDVEPVAGLDLEVGDPAPQPLRPPPRGQRAQLARRSAARVASVVTLMPLASYGLPRHPRRELLGAVAGEDQVRVAVDEARDHAAAAGVEAPSAAAPPSLHGGHPVALEDQRRVADDPQRHRRPAPGRW